jgi:hypothetical protein
MAAELTIADGNPVWLSPSIVPSTDTVVSPSSSPNLAVVHVNSTDVFVYVKVENTGTLDIGVCGCTATGAWPLGVVFTGFQTNVLASMTDTQGAFTFTTNPLSGDALSGGVNVTLGPTSNRRAWGWSPDGRMFAYIATTGGNEWHLRVVALQAITRSDGTTVMPGQFVVDGVSGTFSAAWTNSQFRWGASQAVIVSGPSLTANFVDLKIACPEAPAISNVHAASLDTHGGNVAYDVRVSPCAARLTVLPKILNAAAGTVDATMVSTADAQVKPFKKNNATTAVTIVGANPSITTNAHNANGVRVDTGAGATIDVDDPECTAVGGSVMVHVDRVKASTLPTGNLGVVAVGTASAGALAQGQSLWVQVANTNGWNNQGETHWCLLAQAYTSDGAIIASPWDGQAASPPAFPLSAVNCAQRNVDIV